MKMENEGKTLLEEIELVSIELLEEPVTPVAGGICGFYCYGGQFCGFGCNDF